MATKITRSLFGTTRAFHVVTLGLQLETLEQLAEMTARDVRRLPNCGATTMQDLRQTLARHGLDFSLEATRKSPEPKPIERPWKPEYLDMLRGLRRIAEFPLVETASPDSPAVYMRAIARHILCGPRGS